MSSIYVLLKNEINLVTYHEITLSLLYCYDLKMYNEIILGTFLHFLFVYTSTMYIRAN